MLFVLFSTPFSTFVISSLFIPFSISLFFIGVLFVLFSTPFSTFVISSLFIPFSISLFFFRYINICILFSHLSDKWTFCSDILVQNYLFIGIIIRNFFTWSFVICIIFSLLFIHFFVS